jgi:hypothetical protein
MFVSSAKYNDLVRDTSYVVREYRALLSQWNSLVARINKHGGEAIFDRPAKATPQFTDDEIRSLIQLCHPDRHNGKESAVRMTQKLTGMRK